MGVGPGVQDLKHIGIFILDGFLFVCSLFEALCIESRDLYIGKC